MGLKLGLLYRWTNIGEKCSRKQGDEEVFVPNKEKVTGDWRELFNEESHYVHTKLNIIWLSKSKNVLHWRRIDEHAGLWLGGMKERDG